MAAPVLADVFTRTGQLGVASRPAAAQQLQVRGFRGFSDRFFGARNGELRRVQASENLVIFMVFFGDQSGF